MNLFIKIFIGIIILAILVLVLRVGELYTQLARYRRYWDRVNQRPVSKDDLIYVAFGDSAAQGIGATRPDKGYVGLIAQELARDNGTPVHIVNLSKSGAKVSDVLQTQLPKYKSLKITNKQVITIEIGANDIIDFDARKFRIEMDELMKSLPPRAVISDIPSFSGSRLAKLEGRVIRANEIIRELAGKHGFKKPAELHANVEKNHGLRTLSADFFHPSDYGYKTNWAPAFIERINAGKNTL